MIDFILIFFALFFPQLHSFTSVKKHNITVVIVMIRIIANHVSIRCISLALPKSEMSCFVQRYDEATVRNNLPLERFCGVMGRFICGINKTIRTHACTS